MTNLPAIFSSSFDGINELLLNFSFNNISCFGTADGAIDITITGGTQNTTPPFYNVSWSGPSFFSTNTDINNLVTSGTYTSVITDANSCSAFPISQYISSPQPLSASVYSQDISCYGYDNGLIDLDLVGGSAPYSVSWTGPNGFTSVLEDIQNENTPFTSTFSSL